MTGARSGFVQETALVLSLDTEVSIE